MAAAVVVVALADVVAAADMVVAVEEVVAAAVVVSYPRFKLLSEPSFRRITLNSGSRKRHVKITERRSCSNGCRF